MRLIARRCGEAIPAWQLRDCFVGSLLAMTVSTSPPCALCPARKHPTRLGAFPPLTIHQFTNLPLPNLHARHPGRSQRTTDCGRHCARWAGAGAGGTRLRQDARPDPAHRLPGARARRGPLAAHGRDLHQQGCARDAQPHRAHLGQRRAGRVRAGQPQRAARPHHRHLPRHLRPDSAPRARAYLLRRQLRDLRQRRPTACGQGRDQGAEPERQALPAAGAARRRSASARTS